MGVSARLCRIFWGLKALWHRHMGGVLQRNYLISFVLIGVLLGCSWYAATEPVQNTPWQKAILGSVIFLTGALLTTNYDILRYLGLHGLYGWVHDHEKPLDQIRRYYHAKRLRDPATDFERIPLTYWENGKYRAFIDDPNVTEGLHFWVKVDVKTSGDEGVETPIFMAEVELESLRETSEDGTKLGFFRTRHMRSVRDAVDNHEKECYKEVFPKLLNNDPNIEPYLTIRVADEVEEVSIDDIESLYKGLRAVGGEVLAR